MLEPLAAAVNSAAMNSAAVDLVVVDSAVVDSAAVDSLADSAAFYPVEHSCRAWVLRGWIYIFGNIHTIRKWETRKPQAATNTLTSKIWTSGGGGVGGSWAIACSACRAIM